MTLLRIAHVLPSFEIGGQERVALDVARAHRAAGHRVLACTFLRGGEGPLAPAFREAGVETRLVPKGPRLDPLLPVRFAALFAREGIDVVHTHNPLALVYGAPAGRLAGAVVVHTKHGENREEQGRRLVLRRAVASLADAFVAVSAATAEAARATRDVAEGKLRVIPNGIDVARFSPGRGARAAVRAELGIPGDAWVVGTVGRIAPGKNQALLVRVLAGSLGPGARLLVVGDGPDAGALREAAAAAGVARWTHVTGARADVPRLLEALDVFALPSLSEGLPLVVLEAMATALPVVASAVGGLPVVVAEGETGHLVPPGDAAALGARLAALAAEPGRARALGACGREVVVARYSLERMSAAYLELYDELLRRRGRRTADVPAPRPKARAEGGTS